MIPASATRRCRKCLREQPEAAFSKDSRYRDGKSTRCKECDSGAWQRQMQSIDPEKKKLWDLKTLEWRRKNREKVRQYNRATNYGISPDEMNRLIAQQKGRCAICAETPRPGKNSPCPWTVDHCHETGRVRGLLCGDCNRTVGFYEKLIRRGLVAATDKYLGRPR
jgi:hypothetical protein